MDDADAMMLALRLAKRGYGATSPNPMVGAVLVRGALVLGRGWHRRAGWPHAEIEALADAQKRGHSARSGTLYVTLEPCCTHGRTPPCTEALIQAGIKRVVVGAVDPNPLHRGKGLKILSRAGLQVTSGVLQEACTALNEAFNHWIVHRTPFVTVKAAMTLDGKIATASGQSKWITGERARDYGMKLRGGSDAILVGINTILADDPSLTYRKPGAPSSLTTPHTLRRFVLDSRARTPLSAKVVSDPFAPHTTIVVGKTAPQRRVSDLSARVNVLVAPERNGLVDLRWLMRRLGAENVTSLLVEGGGEVNASFLFQQLAHRIAFFYAPKILGGSDSRPGVAGPGARSLEDALKVDHVQWRKLGPDWLLTAHLRLPR